MTKQRTTKNIGDIPKNREKVRNNISKIVVNVGLGRMSQKPGFLDKMLPQIKNDLATITGQAPQERKAKKSIAGFKLRQGQIVGLRVTLRRERMVDFFERLITMVLPRVHDFGGLSLSSVDKEGGLNIGINEQFVFPETDPEKSAFTFPLGINIVPKTANREESIQWYRELGVPLQEEKEGK